MLNNNSPLESVASFALTFAASILSTVAMSKYVETGRRCTMNRATRDHAVSVIRRI
jgi:hypothetical protein